MSDGEDCDDEDDEEIDGKPASSQRPTGSRSRSRGSRQSDLKQSSSSHHLGKRLSFEEL